MPKHSKQILKYGLRENKLIHISEVANGLSCLCTCTSCGSRLVAKNNLKNQKDHHFSHYKTKECAGAVESALHLLAKTIFSEKKKIRVPNYHFDYLPNNPESLFNESREICFDDVVLERKVISGNCFITPDAIGIIDRKEIYIEFAKTHFVDITKTEKIKQMKKPCIEIDLSEIDFDADAIYTLLITDTPHKYWIINPRQDAEYLKFKDRKLKEEQEKKTKKQRKEEEEFRYQQSIPSQKILAEKDGLIYNCPLKKQAVDAMKQKKHFYDLDVVKRIIDGAYWNRRFYGIEDSFIYVDGVPFTIYPDNEGKRKLSVQEMKHCDRLYAGLNIIKETIHNPSQVVCDGCEFSVKRIRKDEQYYRVCKHPK